MSFKYILAPKRKILNTLLLICTLMVQALRNERVSPGQSDRLWKLLQFDAASRRSNGGGGLRRRSGGLLPKCQCSLLPPPPLLPPPDSVSSPTVARTLTVRLCRCCCCRCTKNRTWTVRVELICVASQYNTYCTQPARQSVGEFLVILNLCPGRIVPVTDSQIEKELGSGAELSQKLAARSAVRILSLNT